MGTLQVPTDTHIAGGLEFPELEIDGHNMCIHLASYLMCPNVDPAAHELVLGHSQCVCMALVPGGTGVCGLSACPGHPSIRILILS